MIIKFILVPQFPKSKKKIVLLAHCMRSSAGKIVACQKAKSKRHHYIWITLVAIYLEGVVHELGIGHCQEGKKL